MLKTSFKRFQKQKEIESKTPVTNTGIDREVQGDTVPHTALVVDDASQVTRISALSDGSDLNDVNRLRRGCPKAQPHWNKSSCTNVYLRQKIRSSKSTKGK